MAPCMGVPLPAGRPTPSGPMEMSQAAASDSEIGLPNFGMSAARAALLQSKSAAKSGSVLDVDMAHRSLRIDAPARDRVDVAHRETRDRRCRARRATLGDQLFARRL